MVSTGPALAIPVDPQLHALEIASALDAFAALLQRALAPLSTVTPREFAETIMRMPDAHGATRPFTFAFAPYQLEPYLEIFQRRNQEVVMMMASRLGKSRIVLTALGYFIKEDPCRLGVMWPVEGDGKLWVKDEFMGELVEPTPELAALIDDSRGQRNSKNTILHKSFLGGLLQVLGANAPGRLRRMKARVLYADEIDAIHIQANDEGNVLLIFKKRGAEFADVIEIYCSYPSLKGRSNIESKMSVSDWRVWPSTCLLCGGEPYVMHRSQLRYDKEKPHEARLECPRCKGLLTDLQRYTMMMGGDVKSPRYDLWTPTKPFTGKAGFHANALLWPHPVDPEKFPGGFLQLLAQQEIDAEQADNPERARRVIVNTVDAETYEAECDAKPEHTKLFLRREKYDPAKILPAGVLWIGIQWDIQNDRAEGELVGHGLRSQTWGLGYHVVKGNPMCAPTTGIWAEMDRIFTTTTFAHPSGKTLRLQGELVDRGFKPDYVLAYTRPRAPRGTFASRGATSLSKPIIRAKPSWEGNPRSKVWEIGTHEAKDILYQRLDRDNREAEGYMHYPAIGCYSEQYFKMLTAEDSTMERAGDGKFYRCFRCEQGVRNEALDIRVMSLALVRIRKPNFPKLAQDLALRDPNAPASANQKPETSNQKPSSPPRRGFVGKAIRHPGQGFVKRWR